MGVQLGRGCLQSLIVRDPLRGQARNVTLCYDTKNQITFKEIIDIFELASTIEIIL